MSLYQEFARQYPDLPVDDLADRIEASGKTDAKRESIKQCIRRARRNLEEDVYEESPPDIDIDNRARDGDWYEMRPDDRVYVFYIVHEDRTAPVTLPYPVVQSIFEWYAGRDGLTIDQTVRKLHQVYEEDAPDVNKITDRYFRRIKETLSLTHGKKPFAPHMYKEHNEDELEKMYLEKVESKLETKLRSSETEHWKSRFKEERRRTLTVEMFFEQLEEEIARPTFPEVDPLARKGELEPTDVILQTGDWHIGKRFETAQHRYNYSIFRQRFHRLKAQIRDHFTANQRPVDTLYLCDMGDTSDGPMGDMHPEQGIHQDLHGVEQIERSAQALAELADFCHKLLPDAEIVVEKVGGNHERVKSAYNADRKRLAAGCTVKLAEAYCESVDQWHYEPGVIRTFRVGPTQVFVTHGDRCPSDFRDIVHTHRDPAADYFLVLLGHTHSLEIIEDLDMIKAVSGSLVGSSDYSLGQLGKGARPSQTLHELRSDGPRPGIWLPVGG